MVSGKVADKSNHKNQKVSVIIPVYNTEKYLSGCLLSVANQTYNNLEAIIIDDGSPDNSYAIASSFVNEDKRFSFIQQKNKGLSGARNTGIKAAKGDYLLFLDSDDQLENTAIEKLVEVSVGEDAEIVVPDRYIKIFDGSDKRRLEYHFRTKKTRYNTKDFALEVMMGMGRAWRSTAVLYSATLFKKHNILFKEGIISEDFVFNLDALSVAKSLSVYNGVTLINLKRQGSITTTFNEKLIDSYFILDEEALAFIQSNDINPLTGRYYRDSAMCRNVVVYLTFLLSNQNQQSLFEKLRAYKLLLKNQRIKSAFSSPKKSTPYFNNKIIVFYFQLVFYLIKHKLIFPSFFLTLLASKTSR